MKEFIKNLKFVWIYAKGQKFTLIKYIITFIISIIISLVIPILTAKRIIYLTDNNFTQLLVMAVTIFLIEIFQNFTNYFQRTYSQKIYRTTFTNFQIDLGKNILKLHNKSLEENSSGVFIQRMTSDASSMSDVFVAVTSTLSTIISDIGIFVAIFIVNKIFFIVMALTIAVRYISEKFRIDIYTKNNKERKLKNEKVTGFVGELVRGTRDIKMLNAENSFIKEFSNRIKDLNDFAYNMMKTNRKFTLMGGSIYDLTDLLIIITLGYLTYKNHIKVAIAIVLLNYSERVVYVVNNIVSFIEYIKEFNLSSERVISIMDNNKFKKENFGTTHLPHINGDFEFKNVYFSYGKEKVLKGINFKVNANETIAFVGKSGAGKTTIFNLLCKMYEPGKGTITIDGKNIKKLDKDTIRGNITIISQDPYIFNMTIRENLELVKENLTEEDMILACKQACLHDYIMSLPDKYDTVIGEGGVNLSGGQKQRLAIARAFVQKTEIILFDEATSALDNETQEMIQKAIENMKGEYTILIIAHRLSTIINADRIIFINDGVVEAEGSHSELMKKCKNYKHLYESEIKDRK